MYKSGYPIPTPLIRLQFSTIRTEASPDPIEVSVVNRHNPSFNRNFNGFSSPTAGSSRATAVNGRASTKGSLHWERHFSVVERQISADGVHNWPFRPGFPLDYLAFTCSGPNVRMNRHDYCEVMYVHSGAARFELQDRSYPISCGDLVVVGPSLYHRVFLEPGAKAKLALIFFEPGLLNDPSTAESAEYLMPFFQQPADFPVVISASTGVPAQVFDFMEKMRGQMPTESTRARLTVKTFLKMILVLLLNHYAELLDTREAFHQRESDIQRLEPVFGLLETNYAQHVGVNEAARRCAMSSSHFMFFFKRVTGQSFISYANHFRVAKAQELLRATGESISDISQETGFCDQSHFGSTFRRLVGMTPREYRRQFGRKGCLDAAKEAPTRASGALVH